LQDERPEASINRMKMQATGRDERKNKGGWWLLILPLR